MINIPYSIVNGFEKYDDRYTMIYGRDFTFGDYNKQIAMVDEFGTSNPNFITNHLGADFETEVVSVTVVLGDSPLTTKIYCGVKMEGINPTYKISCLNGNGTRILENLNYVFNGIIRKIIINNDNSMIIIGDFTMLSINNSPETLVPKVVKILPNNTIDNSFNTINFNGLINGCLQLKNGDFIVYGNFTKVNNIDHGGVLKITPNGSIVSNFMSSTNGGFKWLHPNGGVNKVMEYGDFLYCCGSFTSYAGLPTMNGFCKLSSNGILINEFGLATKGYHSIPNNYTTVFDFTKIGSGAFLLAGNFFEFSDKLTYNLAILHPNGVVDHSFNEYNEEYGILGYVKKLYYNDYFDKIYIGGEVEMYQYEENGFAIYNNYRNKFLDGQRLVTYMFLAKSSIISIPIKEQYRETINTMLAEGYGNMCIRKDDYLEFFDGMVAPLNSYQNDQMFPRRVLRLKNNLFQPNVNSHRVRTIELFNQDMVYGGDGNFLGGAYRLTYATRDNVINGSFPYNSNTDYNNIIKQSIYVRRLNLIITVGLFSDGTRKNIWASSLNPYTTSIADSFNANLSTGSNLRINTILDNGRHFIIGGETTSYKGTSVQRLFMISSTASIINTFDLRINNNYVNCLTADEGMLSAYAGGTFTAYSYSYSTRGISANRFLKFDPFTGLVDTNFMDNLGSGFNGEIYAIKVLKNKLIAVGGSFTSVNGVSRERFAILNSDGSLNTTIPLGTGFDNSVLAIDEDISLNRIYIGGNFGIFKSSQRNKIVAIDYLGNIVSNFNVGSGFDREVDVIKVDSNCKIYIGGDFNTYKNLSALKITRLLPNGDIDNNNTNWDNWDYDNGNY